MRALVDAGVLRIVAGGAAAGAYLTRHPQVDEIHITGSDKTYNAIVFGTGDEGERRRAAGQRLLDKPVTAELGNVSPVIVVPGEWSRADLLYQAENVATMLANNAGFNCLSIRVLVTHEGWPQRQAFLGALEAALAAIPTRRAYYPGAVQREQAFLADHPDAELLGAPVRASCPGPSCATSPRVGSRHLLQRRGVLQPLLRDRTRRTGRGVLPRRGGQVLQRGGLGDPLGDGPRASPLAARPAGGRFARTGGGGPALRRHRRQRLARAGLCHLEHHVGRLSGPPRHGHPVGGRGGGQRRHVSGTQKSVVRGPFRSRPKPAWFATNTNTYPVMRQLLDFEAKPRPSALAKLLAASLKG